MMISQWWKWAQWGSTLATKISVHETARIFGCWGTALVLRPPKGWGYPSCSVTADSWSTAGADFVAVGFCVALRFLSLNMKQPWSIIATWQDIFSVNQRSSIGLIYDCSPAGVLRSLLGMLTNIVSLLFYTGVCVISWFLLCAEATEFIQGYGASCCMFSKHCPSQCYDNTQNSNNSLGLNCKLERHDVVIETWCLSGFREGVWALPGSCELGAHPLQSRSPSDGAVVWFALYRGKDLAMFALDDHTALSGLSEICPKSTFCLFSCASEVVSYS